MEKELAALKRVIFFQGLCVALMAMTFLVSLSLLGFLIWNQGKGSHAPVIENTANPEFTNQVTTGNRLDHVKDRAEKRGYYYQAEFAEVMGVSEKTIQRRIDDGRLDPPPFEDSEGRVAIPLDVEILPSR